MWEFNNKYISVQLEFVVTVTSSGYSLWFCMFISMLQALMLFERWLNKTTSVYPSPHSFHCVVLRIHLLVPWSVYSEWLALCLCLSLHQESSQGFIRVHAPQFLKVSMAVELTEDLQASDVLTRFLSQDRYRDTHTHTHTFVSRIYIVNRLLLRFLSSQVVGSETRRSVSLWDRRQH